MTHNQDPSSVQPPKGAGDKEVGYEITGGSDDPVWFDVRNIDPATTNEVESYAIKDPGFTLLGWDTQDNPVVSFQYAKPKQDASDGLEQDARIMIVTGSGKGVFKNGHEGQWPADYVVGPQVGTVQYDADGTAHINFVNPGKTPCKHFSLDRVYGRNNMFTFPEKDAKPETLQD